MDGSGPHKSMVLTENGNLYSWGRFAFLGHGTHRGFSVISRPMLVPGFKSKSYKIQ
jgi:hypothetical protein